MSDEPPLVTRPDLPPADPSPAPAPKRPGMGVIEAGLWCLVFLACQTFFAAAVGFGVFAAYAFTAPEPGKFTDEQLRGLGAKSDDGSAAPVPFAIGQALAWGMLAAQVGSLAFIRLVLPRKIGPDWKSAIALRPPRPFHVVLVLLIAPGFLIAPEVVEQLVRSFAQWELPAPDLKGVFGPFPWVLTGLAVAVGPGLVEELWFRGFLGRGLTRRYGLVAGVLLTSVLFAVAHIAPTRVPVYTLMGLYLHFVYYTTRSLWAPVLLHALNNGAAITLLL
ncbi:MAG: CPBP family intramembrane metalloprotease, partial [Gemmataceae bacterium]|nr:CPBP family intramembrane metalloprotease [Gemmataceae bacterium]